MILKKNILLITGQDTSDTMGGLERWYCKYAEIALKMGVDGELILVYNEKLPADDVQHRFDQFGIKSMVFKYSEVNTRIEEYKNLLHNHSIGYVFAHFENTIDFLPPAKKLGIYTTWTLHMGNYYFINTSWKKNLKLFLGVAKHRWSVRKKLNFVDAIYCVSEGVRKEFKGFYGHNRKFKVNYFGLDTHTLQANRDKITKKQNHEGIIVSCIAFHAPVKGVDILIKAVAELNKRGYSDVRYFEIGGSQFIDEHSDTNKLKQLAHELNLFNFEWKGISSDVFQYLLQSDIYCQPSRHEALSFAIMEAMSVGLPIVASNTCGIPELVNNKRNGLLFERENVLDLANKLEMLIKNKDERERMGVASLKYILDPKFNTEFNIKQLIKETILK